MKINDVVDKVYLMNLDRREDRLHRSTAQMLINEIEFERFAAVDGSLIENNTHMNNGQYGNYLSHMNVLKLAIDNGYEKIAIFEDDIEFCDDFKNKFSISYPLIPNNWNMVYLGWNTVSSSTFPTNNPEVLKLTGAYAIHAILIDRQTMEKAYSDFSNCQMQADVYYAELQNHINAYGVANQLCSQMPDWSDIENVNVNYRWIFGWND